MHYAHRNVPKCFKWKKVENMESHDKKDENSITLIAFTSKLYI